MPGYNSLMPRARSERRSPWPAIVLVVVLLPVLYVANIGPTGRCPEYGGDYRRRAWRVAYAPVLWAANQSDAISIKLERYLRFCEATEQADIVRFERTGFMSIGILR